MLPESVEKEIAPPAPASPETEDKDEFKGEFEIETEFERELLS